MSKWVTGVRMSNQMELFPASWMLVFMFKIFSLYRCLLHLVDHCVDTYTVPKMPRKCLCEQNGSQYCHVPRCYWSKRIGSLIPFDCICSLPARTFPWMTQLWPLVSGFDQRSAAWKCRFLLLLFLFVVVVASFPVEMLGLYKRHLFCDINSAALIRLVVYVVNLSIKLPKKCGKE